MCFAERLIGSSRPKGDIQQLVPMLRSQPALRTLVDAAAFLGISMTASRTELSFDRRLLLAATSPFLTVA